MWSPKAEPSHPNDGNVRQALIQDRILLCQLQEQDAAGIQKPYASSTYMMRLNCRQVLDLLSSSQHSCHRITNIRRSIMISISNPHINNRSIIVSVWSDQTPQTHRDPGRDQQSMPCPTESSIISL